MVERFPSMPMALGLPHRLGFISYTDRTKNFVINCGLHIELKIT